MKLNFTAKTWKQGNSMLVTIPVYIRKNFGLKFGEELDFSAKINLFGRYVCKCGNVYTTGDKSDHKCSYAKFSTEQDAAACAELLKEKK